jgi:hypothetical protein
MNRRELLLAVAALPVAAIAGKSESVYACSVPVTNIKIGEAYASLRLEAAFQEYLKAARPNGEWHMSWTDDVPNIHPAGAANCVLEAARRQSLL